MTIKRRVHDIRSRLAFFQTFIEEIESIEDEKKLREFLVKNKGKYKAALKKILYDLKEIA